MFLSASVDNPLSQSQIEDLFYKKLNQIGDVVFNKHRFGIGRKVDRFQFIKAKHLLNIVNTANGDTCTINKLYTALINN